MRIIIIFILTVGCLGAFAQQKSETPKKELKRIDASQQGNIVTTVVVPSKNVKAAPKRELVSFDQIVVLSSGKFNPSDTKPMQVTRKPRPLSENINQSPEKSKKD